MKLYDEMLAHVKAVYKPMGGATAYCQTVNTYMCTCVASKLCTCASTSVACI